MHTSDYGALFEVTVNKMWVYFFWSNRFERPQIDKLTLMPIPGNPIGPISPIMPGNPSKPLSPCEDEDRHKMI